MAGDKQTFTGRHLVNIKLTGPGSEKDTRHHEISFEGAPVSYLPGDALGAIRKTAALVERIITRLGATEMSRSASGPSARSCRFIRRCRTSTT